MMTFDKIATALLHEYGYEILECGSDEEAVNKAEDLKKGSIRYPVYYSGSDTSGEKAYEEFYTDSETVDMDRFRALGVVVNKDISETVRVGDLLTKLNFAFKKEEVTKEEIILIMKRYLPNFEHLEAGKSLDSKM